MATVIQLVLAVVVLLLGGKFLLPSRKESTGQDPDLKDKLDELKRNIELNKSQEKVEETKRIEIVKSNEEEKNKDLSNEDLAEFFNNRPKPQ